MKKKMIAAAAACIAALALSGCEGTTTAPKEKAGESPKQEAVSSNAATAEDIKNADTGEVSIPSDSAETVAEDFTDDTVDSFVELGEYKGLEIEAAPDTPVEKGMTVNISYVGTVGGSTFDGGSDDDLELEVGSGSFDPAFEKQLVGHKAGDEAKIKVSYPDDYWDDELAGLKVVYNVKINHVYKQSPDVAGTLFFDSCKVKKYPKSLEDELIEDYIVSYSQSMDEGGASKNKSLEEVLEETGLKKSTFLDMIHKTMKERMCCEAVFIKEGVSREDSRYGQLVEKVLEENELDSIEECASAGLSESEIYRIADLRMLQDIMIQYEKQ